MNTASFGPSPMENSSTFMAVEPRENFKIGGIYENRSFQKTKGNKHLF